MYLHNQTNVSANNIENILKQLPKPYIIIGDLNAHNIKWGSKSTDARGKTIENIINNKNTVILNDTSPTHINIANGNYSCTNLTKSNLSSYC